MATSESPRQLLLRLIAEQAATNPGSLQAGPILRPAGRQLRAQAGEAGEQAVLQAWYGLLRDGVVCPGVDMMNDELPFFHLTERGKRVLEQLSRDPHNPEGFLAAIRPHLAGHPVAESYVTEAVQAFNAPMEGSPAAYGRRKRISA